MKRVAPDIRIIGVQSEAAPAVARSWEVGHIVRTRPATFAESIATGCPGELAFEAIKNGVDEMRLVTENELRRAILRVLADTGQIVEGAGAAPFAVAEKFGCEWHGGEAVLILSGGNLAMEQPQGLLTLERNQLA
jgi:threonine dehydratase